MTVVGEFATSPVVTAVPQRVRLSFIGTGIHLDASLPMDIPVAAIVPVVVDLVHQASAERLDTGSDSSHRDVEHHLWALQRYADEAPLPPHGTLRDAGVSDGALLVLTSQRALSGPTLHDDVVDAAARLNSAARAGWNGTAARWTALTGLHLITALWTGFLVADTFAPDHPALVTLSALAMLGLVGLAAWAHRSHGQADVATALGLAALPIVGALTWVGLSDLGYGGLAMGCLAVAVATVVIFGAIGTGRWIQLAAGVLFGIAGAAMAVVAAGVRTDVVGVVLAIAATLSCSLVPRFATRMQGRKSFGNDTHTDQFDVSAHVRSVTFTRMAIYAGLAGNVGLGVLLVLREPPSVTWPGLTFALASAITLALYGRRPLTGTERAALWVPAAALAVLACSLAQQATAAMALTAFGGSLVAAVGFAAIGTRRLRDTPSRRSGTAFAYARYVATVAMTPLAMWVLEMQAHWEWSWKD